jgi:Fic family protein
MMTSVAYKTINGKRYLYAENSFRLPDGKIKKISKLIREEKEKNSREIRNYFMKKQIKAYQDYALKTYEADSILTSEQIKKLESIRIEYRKIIKNLTKNQIKDILDRFTVNFTYESNAIEGNSLTLKDVTLILGENVVPKNKDLREVYETKNTREAHELLFRNRIKINIRDIINIHSILIKDTGVQSGFKKIPNYLAMRNLKTTLPEKVEEEMKKLISWYESNKDKIHPLRLASEFHAMFESIHPFDDGNGRTGRILLNAILLEHNYPPLIIRKTARIAYFSSLEAFDKGYKGKLERFLLDRIKDTFEKFFKIYVKYL